jgi:hypothetical protein
MREIEAAIVQITIKQNVCQLFSDFHTFNARLISGNNSQFFCFCKDWNQECGQRGGPYGSAPAVQSHRTRADRFIEADDAPGVFLGFATVGRRTHQRELQWTCYCDPMSEQIPICICIITTTALSGWTDHVSYAFEASNGQVINQSLGKRSITI